MSSDQERSVDDEGRGAETSWVREAMAQQWSPGLAAWAGLNRLTLWMQGATRAVWVVAGSRAALVSADPLLAELRRNHHADRLQILVPRPRDLVWAQFRYPNDGVMPMPVVGAVFRGRLARRIVPRLIIEVGAALPSELWPPGVPGLVWPAEPADPATSCPWSDPDALPPARGSDALRTALGWDPTVRVLAAAAVTPAEESLVADFWMRLRAGWPGTRLLVEPTRPIDVRRWEAWALRAGMKVARRSAGPSPDAEVVVADLPGEFPALAEAAGAVWIGGSLGGNPDFNPAAAARWGCPVLFGPRPGNLGVVLRGLQRAGLAFPITTDPERTADWEAVWSLRERARRVTVAAQLQAPSRGAAMRLVAAWRPQLGPPEAGPRRRQSWEIPKGFTWLGQTAVGRHLTEWRAGRRIGNLAELRRRLGSPDTILCLGNGPSSEDPRVTKLRHDALFRVNWRWKDCGLLTRADLVYVGDPHTVEQLPGRRFVFWDQRWERIVSLRDLARRPWARMEYVCLETLDGSSLSATGHSLASGGVQIVRLAVELAPRRLVIAGIDLFSDPAGRYPGDLRTVNEYAAVHRREDELEMLVEALRPHRGELQVVGEPLLRELRARGVKVGEP